MRKEPAINMWEQDWTTGWRNVLCYVQNQKRVGKRVKRAMNKRTRQKGKAEYGQL